MDKDLLLEERHEDYDPELCPECNGVLVEYPVANLRDGVDHELICKGCGLTWN